MIQFLVNLVLTFSIETGLGVLVVKSVNRKKLITVIVAANLITNPLLNFLDILGNGSAILILEIIAICVEWWIYRKYLELSIIKCLMLSIFLNIASLILGIIITSLFFTI